MDMGKLEGIVISLIISIFLLACNNTTIQVSGFSSTISPPTNQPINGNLVNPNNSGAGVLASSPSNYSVHLSTSSVTPGTFVSSGGYTVNLRPVR